MNQIMNDKNRSLVLRKKKGNKKCQKGKTTVTAVESIITRVAVL